MTELMIKKWGNSLAARIPKSIAKLIDLKQDQNVTMEVKNGQIIITPIQKQTEYSLDELLDQCPSQAVDLDEEDKEWLNATPVGKEW